MSRFRKLTHAIWHCQYHIVWVPKYRFRILKNHPQSRKRRYWGNHFWAPGYCVDTVGLDAEMIRRYVRYQEQHEKKVEQQQLKF
jgi:putative transposase